MRPGAPPRRARGTARAPRRAVLAASLLASGCIHAPPSPQAGSAAVALPPVMVPAPLRSLGGFDIHNGRLGAGGLSALHLGPGLVATLLDDRGGWAQARIVLRGGLAAALEPIAAGPLRDGSGAPLPPGYASDAEALARLPDGTWLVGFERWHRIRAYRDLAGPGAFLEPPEGLDHAPRNGGLEALALLADGRLLALTERLAPPGRPDLRRGWVGAPGAWAPLAYRPAAGFLPVDAAGLPDGGALVLERRFRWHSGFAGRLVRLPAGAIVPGAVLEGTGILRMDGTPVPAENWEGVAALRHEGRTLVALVADDNHALTQRSLLLLFDLGDGAGPG